MFRQGFESLAHFFSKFIDRLLGLIDYVGDVAFFPIPSHFFLPGISEAN
jgi:hypothetical protein